MPEKELKIRRLAERQTVQIGKLRRCKGRTRINFSSFIFQSKKDLCKLDTMVA